MSDSRIKSQAAKWAAPRCVKALTTLRTGGVSTGSFHSLNLAAHVGDNPEAVRENRIRLSDQLVLPSEPIWLQQVHGRRVVQAESCQQNCMADGSFSRQVGIVCAVLTADCIPLFLTDKLGSFVGLLHVGWRGLVGGVIESGLAALDVKSQELLAWIGPGIGREAFIVGGEIRQQLIQQLPEHVHTFANHEDKWLADLGRMVEQRLQREGVKEIQRSEVCTATDSSVWFSHRRDGQCGRMASLIWLA